MSFFVHIKKADCEMSTVYFPVAKCHVTNIYMKENSNTDFVLIVESVEISKELIQNLSGLQIYSNFAQNSESESLAESSKKLVAK